MRLGNNGGLPGYEMHYACSVCVAPFHLVLCISALKLDGSLVTDNSLSTSSDYMT